MKRQRRREIIGAGLATVATALTGGGALAQAGGQPVAARNRTLVLMKNGARDGRWVDYELWNCYAIGSNHQNGANLMMEPLAYYSAFADKWYMWLAESYKFTPDFRELTIKTRAGIQWSDGTPFSAADVAFTMNSLRDLGLKVKWGVDVQQALAEATVVDPNTVVLKFKVPSPRFFFFAAYKYDLGIYIVPQHIFAGQDWTSFRHFDLDKGWPVTTGPWKVVQSSQTQKVFERRASWWAAERGLAPMPAIERSIWLPNVGEQQAAQGIITNELDTSYDMLPSTFPTMLRHNPKITTHTGTKPPYGYVDWWPISLYVNNEQPPFDDRAVRWAVSNFINRDQLVEVAFVGASEVSRLPMPPYKPLQPYFDAVKDLLGRYDTLEFNPAKGAALLQGKGWKKDASGYWTDAAGTRLALPIISAGTFGAAVGPVLAEMLRRNGVDASLALPPDFNDRFQQGKYTGSIYGHGGSIREPYDTLRLYQGKSIAVPGAHLVNFSRWRNETFDGIVDEIYVTDPDDTAKLQALFRRAMEIWLPDLPDIQLVQNHHRIPMNTTYWTNWPTAENAYINGASWHLTFPLVMWNLKPA
jgi:peptide/nickel transport system substrate-binding protein